MYLYFDVIFHRDREYFIVMFAGDDLQGTQPGTTAGMTLRNAPSANRDILSWICTNMCCTFGGYLRMACSSQLQCPKCTTCIYLIHATECDHV